MYNMSNEWHAKQNTRYGGKSYNNIIHVYEIWKYDSSASVLGLRMRTECWIVSAKCQPRKILSPSQSQSTSASVLWPLSLSVVNDVKPHTCDCSMCPQCPILLSCQTTPPAPKLWWQIANWIHFNEGSGLTRICGHQASLMNMQCVNKNHNSFWMQINFKMISHALELISQTPWPSVS